jgi:organic radical activating enzyme
VGDRASPLFCWFDVYPLPAAMTLKIHEVFYSTIQGEGSWAGCPADFIRLWGCPVGCWFCDTGYAKTDDHGKRIGCELSEIETVVKSLRSPLVVITGGEPMVHHELPDLVQSVLDAGRKASIETSGSFWQPVSDDAWVTLSPKQYLSPRFPVLENVWNRANEIKIVISDGAEIHYYREYLSKKSCQIYLQPEWSTKERTIPIALSLLTENPTYRLSLQMHKLIGVR